MSDLLLPPRYEPLAPLGKGGGGEVWAVRDRITGKRVALKALSEGADEREVLALVREAVALSGVEGLGVPRVLRFGRLPGSDRPYMIRELVEGESLSDLLARRGDPRVHLEAIAQAADQLTRLHRALLLHGDLKPANIIVGPDGRASLVDLGLAATWREGGATPEGLTPRYAAPELFRGEPLTARVEVFALGATIEEVLIAAQDRIEPGMLADLRAVVARATAENPAERYPSADEIASALRRAAHLEEPPPALGVAWPILGLDGASARLLAQIHALRAGGGVVITGPRQSGRSALLRRIAWSLGVEGVAVAWVEAGAVKSTGEALSIELSAHPNLGAAVLLIDDADLLEEADLARVEEVRERGGKLVLVSGVDGAPPRFPGSTFELFPIPPLDPEHARDLVRRAIPSLSDAVVEYVVERSKGWPGQLRSIVAKLERAPVVAPADVDRLLQQDPAAASSGDARAEIHRLLDRGHFEEASDHLATFAADRSPSIAIARARLAANRGEPAQALVELESVREEVHASGDRLLLAFWLLHAARARLRGGEYDEAERAAKAAVALLRGTSEHGRTLLSGSVSKLGLSKGAARALAIAADALAVTGLAQSFATRHQEAKATLVEAVALARSLGDPRVLSVALGSLAVALQRDDQLAEANGVYEEALRAAEAAGDAGSVATMRLNLAGIAKQRGDLAAAIQSLEAAVDMGRRSGRTSTVRQALLNLANLDLYVGRLARARVSIDALAKERTELTAHMHTQLLGIEAEYAFRSGDLAVGDRLCRECAEAYMSLGRPIDAAEARLERVLYLAGAAGYDPSELGREIDDVEAGLGGVAAHRAQLSLARGRVATLSGDEPRAREALDEAIAVARSSGQRDWLWRALEARSALELRVGQPAPAQRDREAALGTLEEIAGKLPRDLREVYWDDPRRRALRTTHRNDVASGPTLMFSSIPPALSSRASTHAAPTLDRLTRVLEINRAIAGEHDLGRLLERVTDHAIALLSAERGFVIVRAGHGGDGAEVTSGLAIRASRDQSGDDPHARFSRSIAEKVISTGEPVVTTSARDDARMADYVSVHQLMLQSIACVPIRARGAEIIGALYLETRLRPAVSFAEEIPTLIALADQVAIAIETARLVSENARRADELARANEELEIARKKLEELLGHRTAQLAATRRDLRSARAVLRGHFGYEGLVGTSDAMRRVYALIDRIKDTDVAVLITGESGTGKEIIARAIHNAGPRGKRPFVGINCGAIPEHLLESELFGHVRGAFTGADRDRKGLFREATEGTILLDEIGEMPQKMQAGLLRVLQEKVVRPVGGTREEPVDTRVIAATHRDLAGMVGAGTFREDLYYRLHVIEVRIPPLRERIDDIPVLIDHFLGIFAARYGRERRSVSRSALKRLAAYAWPGNVRQLENVLLNAWVLSEKDELDDEDFELPDAPIRAARPPAPAPPGPAPVEASSRSDETSLDAHRGAEKDRIVAALQSCNWNRVKAAQLVGLPRRTFYRRLKEYGIQ